MAYLKVSDELLDGLFWDSLAGKEVKMLLKMMFQAPYKSMKFNLYGTDITLNKRELCFSVRCIAKEFGISDSAFRRFMDKLVKMNIITKKKRKIKHSERRSFRRTGAEQGDDAGNYQFYTSITFSGWVFDEEQMQAENMQAEADLSERSDAACDAHKIDIKIDKEEEVFTNARGENFQNYENRTIHFADKPALQEVIPEKSVAYFCESYECRTQDLENLFGLFIRREEASGLYFLRHKELQRRFAYFLEKNYQTKLTHAKKSKHNGNIQQQPEKQREKSEYEKRREAEDAAIIARMPRYGGSSAGLHAIGKRERRYGTKGTE